MKPLALRVAAALTGEAEVLVAIGRKDYIGRFQPYGVRTARAKLERNPKGELVACIEVCPVQYDWDSPRIITHVGVYIFDHWYLDELPAHQQRTFQKGETVAIAATHVVTPPEE